MAQHEGKQQTTVEHEALKHIIGALRTVLDWQPSADDQPRKLSSLRFIAQSFQRHLERLMALKEQDGYLATALEKNPNLADKIQGLRQEHDQISERLQKVVLRLDHVSASEPAAMTAATAELNDLLAALDAHHRREADLMQEAFLREFGGRG